MNEMKSEIKNNIIKKLNKKYPDCTWDCFNIEEAILETIDYIKNKTQHPIKQ